MKDFYIDSIQAKKKGNKKLYEKVLDDVFGKTISWEELKKQNSDDLISVMCQLDKEVKLEQSPYDIKKLASAIQHSRSGAGGCAMTKFECAFCGEDEIWGNTAVPKICTKCAEKMATNFALYNLEITKR